MDDDIAKLFKEDLSNAKNSENINVNKDDELMKYSMQVIEVDAETFELLKMLQLIKSIIMEIL